MTTKTTAAVEPTTTHPEEIGDLVVVVITVLQPILETTYARENYTGENISAQAYSFSEPADKVLGTFIVIFAFIGLIGNIPSLIYFWPRRNKTIHPFLYTIISAVDICTTLLTVPVIVSLFNTRSPVIFASSGVCTSWPVVFYFILKMSMFLVMLLSTTRTLAITKPFYKINKNFVVVGIAVYAAFILGVDVTFLSTGLLDVKYRDTLSLCEMLNPGSGPTSTAVYSVALQVELLLPSLIIFGSFIFGTVSLVTRTKNMAKNMTNNQKQFRSVSITVALFTAAFLLCNLPCFIVQLLYFFTLFWPKALKPIRDNTFFKWYGHLLSHFFLSLLNSALNPCLYFLRMPQYRQWSSETTLNIPRKLNRIKTDRSLFSTAATDLD